LGYASRFHQFQDCRSYIWYRKDYTYQCHRKFSLIFKKDVLKKSLWDYDGLCPKLRYANPLKFLQFPVAMAQLFIWEGARCKTGLPDLNGLAAHGVTFSSVTQFLYSTAMQFIANEAAFKC
jgi:hypothetical protein